MRVAAIPFNPNIARIYPSDFYFSATKFHVIMQVCRIQYGFLTDGAFVRVWSHREASNAFWTRTRNRRFRQSAHMRTAERSEQVKIWMVSQQVIDSPLGNGRLCRSRGDRCPREGRVATLFGRCWKLFWGVVGIRKIGNKSFRPSSVSTP